MERNIMLAYRHPALIPPSKTVVVQKEPMQDLDVHTSHSEEMVNLSQSGVGDEEF